MCTLIPMHSPHGKVFRLELRVETIKVFKNKTKTLILRPVSRGDINCKGDDVRQMSSIPYESAGQTAYWSSMITGTQVND